ncbi:MAG: DUF5615 family PIN-like protein [Planctomycetota bacterium]
MKLFKIDENLPEVVAERLRGAGHDALSVVEQGLAGSSDGCIEEVVRREHRALITLDLGFADIRRHPPDEYDGIIVLRLARQDRNQVLRLLDSLVPFLTNNRLKGRLWIVRSGEVRVRE